MPITGLRATDSFDADARPLNWRAGILWNYPNGKAPLVGLTSVMSKRSVDDPEYNWWEQQLTPQRLTLTAAITSGSTALAVSADPAGKPVGGATQVQPGHLLKAENSGEIMRVTAVASDTSLTVVRGFAGTVAAAVDPAVAGTNPNLRVVGTAFEEGSSAPQPIMYDPSKAFNYTQIFRNTLGMTRTAQKTRLRTVELVREAKRQCLELHSIEMEKAFWEGVRWEGVLNGNPARTTGGLRSFIPVANVLDASAVNSGSGVRWSDFEGWAEQIFTWGSDEKMAFCGNPVLTAIQRMVRGAKGAQVQLVSGQREFGMRVTRLITSLGEIVFKTHPLFNQITGGTTGGTPYRGLNSSAFILDMAELKYVYLDDTKYEAKLEANDLDGMLSGYLTECGLEVHHPENHFLIEKFFAGADEA